MKALPTVYIVNQDAVANSVTKRLLTSLNIFSQDFLTPSELIHNAPFESHCCFLLSFLLPEMNGIELMLTLKRQGAYHPCIFTSPKMEAEFIVKAMHSGCFGFIKKPFQALEFAELIQKALETDRKMTTYARIAMEFEHNLQKLSPREKQVLELLLDDMSAMKIGNQLAISHRTVENHRKKIFSKLDISKTPELVRKAAIYDTVQNTNILGIR